MGEIVNVEQTKAKLLEFYIENWNAVKKRRNKKC